MGLLSSIGKALGSIGSVISPGLGSVLGGGLDFLGGSAANSANRDIANAQMAFQANMSNTSYQRAVKDMQAAGLNPALAYANGGASTPSGSSAVMQNALGHAASNAMQTYQAFNAVQNTQADTTLKNAQAASAWADAKTKQPKASIMHDLGDLYSSTMSNAKRGFEAYKATPKDAPVGEGISKFGRSLGLPW